MSLAISGCWTDQITYETCCQNTTFSQNLQRCWAEYEGFTWDLCCKHEQRQFRSPAWWEDMWDFEHTRNEVRRVASVLLFHVPEACQYMALSFVEERHKMAWVSNWLHRLEQVPGHEWQTICADRDRTQRLGLSLLEASMGNTPEISMGSHLGEGQVSELQWTVQTFKEISLQVQQSLRARGEEAWEHARQEAMTNPSIAPPNCAAFAPDGVHIAMVASVGRPPFGKKALATIRSALFFAQAEPIHFHLFVDSEGSSSVQEALDSMEPWLRAKGCFTLYSDTELAFAWQLVRQVVPADCAAYTSHFGNGWVRLFVHEILDESVKVVVFVDAGDMVFLSDPVVLLWHRQQFREEHVWGSPIAHAPGFQLFDLPRMRWSNWTKLVIEVLQSGYAAHGAGFCVMGEGWVVELLVSGENKHMWYALPSLWSYVPYSTWMPSYGIRDRWSHEVPWGSSIWDARVFQGIQSYVAVEAYCPDFIEFFAHHLMHLPAPPPTKSDYFAVMRFAMRMHEQKLSKNIFEDAEGQLFVCNEKVQAIHLMNGFKNQPWVSRFLNFWSNCTCWNDTWYENRDLRIAQA